MNHIRWLLNSLQFYSLVCLIHSYKPLIFNPHTLEIYKSPEDTLGHNSAVACPAGSDKEIDFNLAKSTSKNSLFIKAVYAKEDKKLTSRNCGSIVRLVAVHNRREKNGWEIQIGYEIFFQTQVFKMAISTSDYQDYGPIDEIKHFFNKRKDRWISLTGNRKDLLNFIWIPKIQLKYDYKSWNLRHVNYKIYRNDVDQLKVNCNDHYLGLQLFPNDRQLQEFYSEENQKKIFSTVELPDDSTCTQTLRCVKSYDLLKPYNFMSTEKVQISCTNLTLIPIWHRRTESVLNYLERFLIAMGQKTNRELSIIAGVHGVVSLPNADSDESSERVELYMHTERRMLKLYNYIPVPKIIYKIVTYQSYNCDEKNKSCRFSVVFAIQNQPNFTEDDQLCVDDMCEQWGWKSIKNLSTQKEGNLSKYIRCCELNAGMIEKLGIPADDGVTGVLSLRSFPVFSEEQSIQTYENLEAYFEDAMQEFSQSESSPRKQA